MQYFVDVHQRQIRLTPERLTHIESNHPEMHQQLPKIKEALKTPDVIIGPRFDSSLELFYRHYNTTPVTQKYICVVVKVSQDDLFVITAYFTDSIKKGEILWEIPPHEKLLSGTTPKGITLKYYSSKSQVFSKKLKTMLLCKRLIKRATSLDSLL